MNTKTLLALAAQTVVCTASASVTSANTLCRIEVNSGTKSTIIAVPLVFDDVIRVGLVTRKGLPLSKPGTVFAAAIKKACAQAPKCL